MTQRREAVAALQVLQSSRNALAKRIGEAKRAKEDTAALEAEGAALRGQMEALEAEVPRLEAMLRETVSAVPNVLDAAVPDGRDETDNKVEKVWGTPREFAFAPKEHFEIGEKLGLMDFAAAGKLAGSRFTVLRGALARLERALGQFMLDVHTAEHGYSETMVPLLVNDAAMFGTGQLPKFAEDLFRTTDGRWLIPTAEVSLTNLVAGEILPAQKLPMRMTALTPCFRSEAGSAGRDVRGMLRQHQFTKVEMVSITHPEESEAEHERMTRCAEVILERLELPYRQNAALCRGYRVFRDEDLRPRSLAAGAGDVSGDLLLLQYRRVPGAADECAVPQCRGQAGIPAYAQRLGCGGRAGADRGAGELPERGWQRDRPGGAAGLYGRAGAD